MRGAPESSEAPRSFFHRQGGFTLVELMITIAIIGILAMVAIPNFMRFREKAKVSEVKANLGAIRVAQYAYFTEYGRYVGNQAYTPDRTTNPPGRFPWSPNTRFTILGYAPDGMLYFSYGLSGVDLPTDNFTAMARSDLDADGNWSTWHLSGGDNEIYHEGADL